MSNTLLPVAELVAAIGAGLVGGVFFGFSTTVMKSMRVIPPMHGITAMQNVNSKILNPRFVGVFMLTTAASALLAVTAPFTAGQPGALARGIAGLIYLVGVFGITVGFNIPLNNALATVDPADWDAARRWDQFLSRWIAWHAARTVAATSAATIFTVTLALQ
jgi:uncharacterized membrane protein